MKRVSNLLAALVFASLVIFMSCGGSGDDPSPSAGEDQANELVGTWTVSNAPTYGGSTEGIWTGFTLTISNVSEGSGGVWGGDFAVSGIPAGYGQVWGGAENDTNVSGSWSFASASNVTDLVRSSDGVTIENINVSASALAFDFLVPRPETARSSGIFGFDWEFQFSK